MFHPVAVIPASKRMLRQEWVWIMDVMVCQGLLEIIILLLLELLLDIRQWIRNFPSISVFFFSPSLWNNTLQDKFYYIPVIISLWENRGLERLSNLPMFSQLVSHRTTAHGNLQPMFFAILNSIVKC